MNRFLWTAIGFGAVAIGCFVAFALIGATIDEQGILREPFFLVPVGWLSAFVAGICMLAGFASKR